MNSEKLFWLTIISSITIILVLSFITVIVRYKMFKKNVSINNDDIEMNVFNHQRNKIRNAPELPTIKLGFFGATSISSNCTSPKMEKKSLQLDCSLISSKPTNSNTASNVDMTVSATNASAKYMLSETKARSFSGVFEEKLQCERDAKTGTSRSGDYPLTTSTHKNNSCVTLNSNSTHDSNHKLDKVPPLLNNFSSKPKVQPNLRKLKKVDSRIIMLQGEPFYHDEFFSGKPA